ncbi:DUF4082 domain-containing protein [Nocardioides solisilvae]|uniref:DUF4082 domain-containing protein n=1 Tax=Nocardioides solisilvae TaxID=1542435 RepID=UPI000D74723F|nr:DUF4082 domain-containing protein [Nocardioides solisilvae]
MLEEPRRLRRRPATPLLLLGLLLALLVVPGAWTSAGAADPCGAGGNAIACENSKPGTPPSVWDIDGAGDASIQGFATDMSVNVGQRIDFKVDTDATAYTIDVYRLGWYQGLGARKIASVTPSATLPQRQPACVRDAATELVDCGNWAVSASWNVPTTAVSGVHVAHLKRSNGDESHITFVVRNDASTSDVVVQTSDTTWQAYNTYGGSSFYQGAANGRAFKLSYNRPVLTRGLQNGRDHFMGTEYPLVRFLERNGYDVSYLSGVDTHRRGQLLTQHDVFVSVGHDEYWTGTQRAHVEAARDAGVNLQFLSGNEVYWRSRYEPSIDGRATPHRTLVTYKETWNSAKIDPSPEWTGTWRDPRFAAPAQGGGLPENALTGTMYKANYSDLPLTVSAAEGKLRLWRHTPLANLAAGSSAQLAPHTVGYESNEDVDNGFRPKGLIRTSTTTGPTPEYLLDYGLRVAPGTTTHHTTLYRAASGALVFSAGSVQWSWGLDAEHDSSYAPEPADVRMQQAQVNLLADMRAQPTTLMAGLTLASRTTDTTGPVVSISAPAAGSTIRNGDRVTVTGTATDSGGRVAGVEVSGDGGQTWHPATGTTSWSWSYVQSGTGTVAVQARATDDSANTGAVASRQLTVTCPCSVFGSEVPATPATADTSAVELGMRFSPTTDGFVSGVRFYKGQGNGGTHVGSLWSATGQLLGRGTFTGETATGWQTLQLADPVPVATGQTYVVSYTAPQGRYALQSDAWYQAPKVATPLRVAGGFGAAPAGVFADAGRFPDRSYGSSNYYVDVLFTTMDGSPLRVGSQSPLPGSTSVPPQSTVSAVFSKPLTSGSASIQVRDALGALVAGSSQYDAATRRITFTPSQPLASSVRHQVTVRGTDTAGQQVSAGGEWAFTTAKPAAAPGVCPCGVYDDATQPGTLQDSETAAVTLGLRFAPLRDGQVSGVQFFKGPDNTGTHVGSLWRVSDGALLAQGTFTGESTSGWQELTFGSPVTVQAGVQYVVGYRTTVGRYSVTTNAFAQGALDTSMIDAIGGAYTYPAGFPSAQSSTSYMVDVVFQKAPEPLTVTAQAPAPGAVEVPRGTSVAVDFSTSVRPGATLTLVQGGTTVPGTMSLGAGGTSLKFTPSSLLAAGSDVQVTLAGVTSTEGAALPTRIWGFRTRSASAAVEQTLFTTQVPATAAIAEASPVELGTAFVPARDGRVTGVRFFKGTGNTGTHRGSLWSADGQRLAQVTFAGESENGWQKAYFDTPVPVTKGTQYVVSYFAPRGHYAVTSGFFSTELVSGDLRAPAGANGRYLYGSDGGFPQYSWSSTSYFVDPVFEAGAATVAVESRSPAPGATGVVTAVQPRLTLTEPVRATGWAATLTRAGTQVPVDVARTADARSLVVTPQQPLATGTTYTVTFSGVVSEEGAVLPTQSWSFTTEQAAAPTTSLFEGVAPATAAASDTAAVELGTKFVPAVNGQVLGVRFHKGTGNTGQHTGSLWSADGQRLAQVTFAQETASGWQSATFDQPVAVTAGTTYVVSYHAPVGRYSITTGFFSQPWTRGDLTAPAGTNGVYRYGSGGVLPTGSYQSSNYFVDVLFRAAP